MSDAPFVPPACVTAVLRVGPCVLNRSETGRAAWAARVAHAVLDAFVAGEGKDDLMPDTPLIPPACVEALRDYSPREAGCPHWLALQPWQRSEGAHDDPLMCDWCAPAIARAMLDAFVAGEGSGPWTVEERPSEGLFRPTMRWRVKRRDGSHWIDGFAHEAKARGCAAVLNYLEAKGE